MLPPRERLTRSSLFQRAYTGRKSISSPIVTLYVVARLKQPAAATKSGGSAQKHSENRAEMQPEAKSPNKMPVVRLPLVGFVVAKKVCKNAVVRNRAKRRIREAYRLLRQTPEGETLALSQWYALAWVVHDKALGATWQEIRDTVRDSLARANARYGSGAKQKNPARQQGQEGTS